jgi:hypothetical protein
LVGLVRAGGIATSSDSEKKKPFVPRGNKPWDRLAFQTKLVYTPPIGKVRLAGERLLLTFYIDNATKSLRLSNTHLAGLPIFFLPPPQAERIAVRTLAGFSEC